MSSAPAAIRLVGFDFDGVMIDFEPERRLQFLERSAMQLRPDMVEYARWLSERVALEVGARKPDTLVFTRLLEHCRVPARQAVSIRH